MKNISLAIMVVGLCFYEAWLKINHKEIDHLASFICFMAALELLFSN